MSYAVFHRTWWRPNPSWPDGREPGVGERQYLHLGVETEEQAQAICREWNETHDPGPLSDKAEYEEE